jgi:hypothetical protein
MDPKVYTEYYLMFDKFRAGEITEKDWQDYCNQCLYDIMNVNKDIFVRMKEWD